MNAPRTPGLFIMPVLAVLSAAALFGASQVPVPGGRLERFHPPAAIASDRASAVILMPGRFSGYTNYWQDLAWTWSQYGNFFQMSVPDVGASILQAKADIAEELGIPGLAMTEGFLSAWLGGPLQTLDNPSATDLEKALAGQSAAIAVFAPLTRDLGPVLMKRASSGGLPALPIAEHAHQRNAADYRQARAFVLEDGPRRLFAVLADE
ncbi:MAG: hypothetical protein ABSA30_12200, partial [Candidatus Aminicenantales bacterium]